MKRTGKSDCTRARKLVLAAALMSAVAGIARGAFAQDLERATPESQGVSSSAVLRWVEACESDAATNRLGRGCLHGFVILRHGRLIAEGTWAPRTVSCGAFRASACSEASR